MIRGAVRHFRGWLDHLLLLYMCFLQAFCAASGILPLTSPDAASIRGASIGTAVHVEELVVGPGGRRALVLGLANGSGSRSLLVAAPSEGLVKHYARTVRAAASLLASSCVELEAGRSVPARSAASDAGCSSQPVRKSDQLPMRLLPGGAAFEAALAAVLADHIHNMHMGTVPAQSAAAATAPAARDQDTSTGKGDGMLMTDHGAQQQGWFASVNAAVAHHLHSQPASVLLPALRVLHAMAVAVPAGLASTGSSSTMRPADEGGSHMPLVSIICTLPLSSCHPYLLGLVWNAPSICANRDVYHNHAHINVCCWCSLADTWPACSMPMDVC